MNMKHLKLMMMALFLVGTGTLAAQSVDADAILGKWLNEDKDAHVEVYQEAGK